MNNYYTVGIQGFKICCNCRRRHDVPAEDSAASGVDLSGRARPAEPDSSSPAVLQAAGSPVQGGSVRQQRPDPGGVRLRRGGLGTRWVRRDKPTHGEPPLEGELESGYTSLFELLTVFRAFILGKYELFEVTMWGPRNIGCDQLMKQRTHV